MQDIERIIKEAERLKASGDKFSVLAPLRELFGLEDGGFEISYKPEVLRYIQPNSKKILNNQIILDSVLDGALWFSAVCAMGYDYVFNSAPTIFSRIFRSRSEALDAAVTEFHGQLEDFSQNTPREKQLVENLNEWLDKIVAENILQDSEDATPLVDANGQVLLFPASEGIPEDFEDEMRKKARAARVQAEMKKMYADERKKQTTMLAKICDREAHFAQVQDVIDEARLTSMKHPKTVWLAVDTSDAPRVTDIEEWKSILPQVRIDFALYAAWRGGLRLPKKEFLALMPTPSEESPDDKMTKEEYDSELGAVLAESLEAPGDETDGTLPASNDGAS